MHKLLLVYCLVLTHLLSGCSAVTPTVVKWEDPDVTLSWPPPPAKERIRYLRTITGAADFKEGQQESSWKWFFGDERYDFPLLTPLAVAPAQDGLVWVADSGSKMLYRIDLSRKRVDYIAELSGERLDLPAGLVFDYQRQVIYLSDASLNKLFALNIEGDLIRTILPPGGFKRPAGLAVDASGFLYVADVLDGSIAVFDNSGLFVRRIYSLSTEGGRFNRPVDVAIGPAGEVVVLAAASFNLEVQSAAGELLQVIGKVGDTAGHFARPKSVAIDSAGHIFVSDAAFDNIQVFDLDGQLLTFLGGPGSQPGRFNLPAGLALDQDNRLFAADSFNRRVQVFQVIK